MTTQNAIRIFYQFSLMIGLASCNLINPDEPIPTYIRIDSVNVKINDPSKEGSSSNKIKDVWVYMDAGEFIGVYELPALFPVIGDAGKHTFSFLPGIYDNGISNTHIIYRLMKGFTTEIDLINGSTAAPSSVPEISYFPGVEFPIVGQEDFEGATLRLVHITGDTLKADGADVFEGTQSGIISLDSTQSAFRFEMFEGVSIPTTSVTYLELNYKCDYPFFVGLKGKKSNGNDLDVEVILINASPVWNKIYINLGAAVRVLAPSIDYKVYCRSALGDGVTSATFHFDNFKLVHN